MGVVRAILDAIANNYIFFVAITIFLVLSLIGYYVDKKTRKDADITPILGKKVSLNIKFGSKKGKKNKKGFSTTIVGGAETNNVGVATMANPIAGLSVNQNSASLNQNAYNNAQMPANITSSSAQTGNYTLLNGNQVGPSLATNNPIQNKTANSMIAPAVETALIDETILPNVATTPAQAQSQGVSTSAPGMETIIPSVNSQTRLNKEEDNGVNMNMMAEDEQSPINFNMNE